MQRANSKIEEYINEPFIGLRATDIQGRRFKIKRDEGSNEEVQQAKVVFKRSREERLNLFMSERSESQSQYGSRQFESNKNLTIADQLCEKSAMKMVEVMRKRRSYSVNIASKESQEKEELYRV